MEARTINPAKMFSTKAEAVAAIEARGVKVLRIAKDARWTYAVSVSQNDAAKVANITVDSTFPALRWTFR